jgi:hypothetical protein
MTAGLTWIPLSTGLLLALGCGTEAPRPSATPATTTAALNTRPARQVKAVGKNKVVDYDDLKARRSKKRSASNPS